MRLNDLDLNKLHTFFAVGAREEVAARLAARFGDVVDRLQVVVAERDETDGGLIGAVRAVL